MDGSLVLTTNSAMPMFLINDRRTAITPYRNRSILQTISHGLIWVILERNTPLSIQVTERGRNDAWKENVPISKPLWQIHLRPRRGRLWAQHPTGHALWKSARRLVLPQMRRRERILWRAGAVKEEAEQKIIAPPLRALSADKELKVGFRNCNYSASF